MFIPLSHVSHNLRLCVLVWVVHSCDSHGNWVFPDNSSPPDCPIFLLKLSQYFPQLLFSPLISYFQINLFSLFIYDQTHLFYLPCLQMKFLLLWVGRSEWACPFSLSQTLVTNFLYLNPDHPAAQAWGPIWATPMPVVSRTTLFKIIPYTC